MKTGLDVYEDNTRLHSAGDGENRYSPGCDLVYYRSSVTPDIRLAMRVQKPACPSPMLVRGHGWHMSMPAYEPIPEAAGDYLTVDVDMRGRAWSGGKPDCNDLELYDVIDAAETAAALYGAYLSKAGTVFFEGGSGGGGNALALAGKFPDYFSHITALYGISDYALWYRNDAEGEFRDEMDVWIGVAPSENPSAYAARSGITTVHNLLAPLFIAHGETDERVPVIHSRAYTEQCAAAGKGGLVVYRELPGVGNRSHTGNATEAQLRELRRDIESERQKAACPPVLPQCGTLLAAGYVRTRYFDVRLRRRDNVVLVHYDLERRFVEIPSLLPEEYTVT